MKSALFFVAGFATLAIGTSPLRAAAPTRYYVTEIAPTSTSESNFAESLNSAGVGVGRMLSGSSNGDRALVFANGATTKLGTLPSSGSQSSYAYGINSQGWIVGDSSVGDTALTPYPHAFLYINGTMQDLGTMGGALSSARAINDAGQIAGRSFTGSGAAPFLWENGQFINLGSLGGSDGTAEDVNQLGNVAGASEAGFFDRAFFWSDLNGNRISDPGEMISLGALGGLDDSVATALNDGNVVVGQSLAGGINQSQAFSWSDLNANHQNDPGEMQALPMLTQGVSSYAYDINDNNLIVGRSQDVNFANRATLWSGADVYDLNSLIDLHVGQKIPVLESARAINNRGQILVDARVSTGLGAKGRVFLLTPVPEPSTLVLCGTGITAMIAYRRRGKVSG